jgi:hypothetical protein
VAAVEHGNAQRARGFELATANLLDNFQTELSGLEARVKEGTAPIRVAHGGGGALDPALLVFLLGLSLRGALWWRGRKSSASARW